MGRSKRVPEISTSDILDLLRYKHREDVFVSECKDGPTWSGKGHHRMDAWTMKRKWTHPLTIAYEIKKSRSDFLRDNKWSAYLPCCNQLFFVCPNGLIQPQEVDERCGLMWVSETGRTLLTKRIAPNRDLVISENVYRYILMCRTQIVAPNRF